MTRTLRRERIQRFTAEVQASALYRYAFLWLEHNAYTGEEIEKELKDCRVALVEALVNAAASRTEAQQEEVIVSADRKVNAILDLDKQAKTAEDAGQAWRGREFLVGSEYCKYGDWWYKKTGLEMYGAKGKAKINTEWMKAFKEWHEFSVTIQTLDEAFQSESWRPIIKPSQITGTAKAIQAAPPVVSNTNEEGKGFYV